MEWPSNKIVSVVIATCGKNDYLKSCLNSLKNQTQPVFETIVIDNSLNSNFSRAINERYPDIKLHSSPKNLFYCEALNKGIKMSKGDFILCLNDDVVLDKGFITEAIRGFLFGPKIGMVSGKILRSDGKTIDSAGLFLTPWRTAKERGYGLKDKGQYEKEEYIFGVNGAVAFYRREMLEAIKVGYDYFDTDYHFFYEDLDIAWRAKRFGWKGYYIPGAVAYHVRGGSVRSVSGINKPYARRYLNTNLQLDLLKNRYLTLIKNDSYLSFLLHLPFILSYDILVWVYILFLKPNLIKKFLLNLKYLKSAFQKRKLIEKLGYV
ncbi:MAG: glycosyltransferase family 2 protein [Candidatus Omnitrophota bacterium]|nr:glycosyltransferase family 2 protein [Candidatus Omnitrophota bacterium]